MEPMFNKSKRNHNKNKNKQQDSFVRKAKANYKRMKQLAKAAPRYSNDEE